MDCYYFVQLLVLLKQKYFTAFRFHLRPTDPINYILLANINFQLIKIRPGYTLHCDEYLNI